MGIKSGLNSVGKVYLGSIPIKKIYHGTNLVFSFDKGDLSLWRYNNSILENKVLLYEYLGNYNNLPNNTLSVPRVGGRAVINTVNSSDYHDSPFYFRNEITNLDLQRVPFLNGDMSSAFEECSTLASLSNLSDSIINMQKTFKNCRNFDQSIRIPNTVTDMSLTFDNCSKFNQSVEVPSSTINMKRTFSCCDSFNQNVLIPSSTLDLSSTFNGCSNFNSWINIYSEKIEFGYINSAFNTNNATSPKIPSVVFPARYINNGLTLTQLSIKYAGWNVSGIGIVEGVSPNQIKSWDVIKGNYNTFKGNGTHWELHKWNGALATALNNGVTVTDVVVPEYFTTYNTFPSALNYSCFRRNDFLTSVDFGCEIPWVGNRMGNQTNSKNNATRVGAFDGCNNMIAITGAIHSNVTQMVDAFSDSTNLRYTHVIIPEGATNCVGLFYNSFNIEVPAPLPSTTTTMGVAFSSSLNTFIGKLSGSIVIPRNVIQTIGLFNGRQENIGNIYVLSPSLLSNNINNIWQNYPKTFKKPFYTYYQYSNNVNTATYETFKKNAIFFGTSGNGVGIDPLYNSISNFYVYNLSNIYDNLWDSTIYLSPSLKLTRLIKYKGNDKHVALMSKYPDWTPCIFDANCFNNCGSIVTLALYDANIYASNGSCINMFRNCYNLRVIQGLRLDKVMDGFVTEDVSLPCSFENCYNLRVMSSIPSSVKNMYYTFKNCSNFDFNIQIKDGVTDMTGTFSGCRSLNKNIKIPNTVITIPYIFGECNNLNQNILISENVVNMKGAFYNCANLAQRINVLSYNIEDAFECFTGTSKFKEVYIPYRYVNGANSKTFNSFISAGYLYNNGVSTGKDNTRFYNIVL